MPETVFERFAIADLRAQPAGSPLQQAVITGVPVTLGRAQLTADRLATVATGEALDLLRELAPGTITVVPLRGRDRILGALTLGLDAARGIDPLDRDAGLEIAGRLALALDNTRLYEQQRTVAVELQRQMLTAPPAPDHVQIAVRYQPATQAAQIGGDWYDVFLQPDGATTVVVGDVLGHDLAAAATMGQLRSMLRALGASANTPPAGLLTQLDGVLPQLQMHTYATIAVARLEQSPTDLTHGTTRLRWASAGHPAPVVIDPNGHLHQPQPWRGQLMMGVDPHSTRTETTIDLQRGSTIILYTDGLIDRRDRDLDDGLTALRSTGRPRPPAPRATVRRADHRHGRRHLRRRHRPRRHPTPPPRPTPPTPSRPHRHPHHRPRRPSHPLTAINARPSMGLLHE